VQSALHTIHGGVEPQENALLTRQTSQFDTSTNSVR
jgi:hypothetical protein